MPRVIEFDGRQIEVPDDFTDDDIAAVLSGPATPVAPDDVRGPNGVPGGIPSRVPGSTSIEDLIRGTPQPKPATGALDYVDNTGSIFLDDALGGIAGMLGAPVDLMNNAPRLANILPGVDGVGPIADKPFLGSESIEDIIGAPASAVRSAIDQPAPEPQDAFQRVVGRVGREVGASAVPLGAALSVAARTGVEGARQMGPLGRMFVEPAAVSPGGLIGKETAYAVGAGGGAGIANEMVGNPQEGDNFWSDLIGSLAGSGIVGLGDAALKTGRNAIGAMTNNPAMMGDTVGEEVVDRIINNSSDMANQVATTGNPVVDTAPLARKLRAPSPVEQAVPGFQANIGDRAQDPLLMTAVQNQDMLQPAAANMRRAANDAAVGAKMTDVAPAGDPALFRSSVEASRDARIAEALAAEEQARAIFGDAQQAATPSTPNATARGSNIRSALADRYAAERARVSEQFAPLNDSSLEVPIAPLAERFGATTDNLPLNDRSRFLPAEAAIPQRLQPLDAEGNVIPDATVPLREVTAARSGLTDDIRTQRAGGQQNAARVTSQYRDQIDDFTEAVMPPELRAQYDTARAARRDVGDRFERPGTGIAETLRPREGGGYALDDSAVPGRFAQPDNGRINDMKALLKEAGTDPRVRQSLADEVLADVQGRGLLEKPQQLARYMDERGILMEQFPELRQTLNRARAAGDYRQGVEAASTATQKRLTTPGRSPEASYLKYGDEATVDAVRNLVSSPKPREAAKALLEAAGNTPEARVNARSALWEAVKTKKYSAPNAVGGERWDYKKLKGFFDDPKIASVADELWSDAPEDLANIKELFGALAASEGSIRTRAANSSGTAQALSGKLDPSLTTTSLASRARSVSRNQLSPTIAAVDVLSTWLRNRSKKVQARAIDTLASSAFNNPELAADLLEKFNPADFAAKRRMISQKYGVRATQILNLLDEADGQDDTREAIDGE